MKKLNVAATGGIPVFLDDKEFVRDGIEEAFDGILGFIKDVDAGREYILSGAVDNPGVDITEGWVVIDGEPCFLPAQTYSIGAGQSAWLAKKTTFDPAGTRTLETGGTTETYEVVEAEVVVDLTANLPVGARELKDTPRVLDIIAKRNDFDKKLTIRRRVSIGTWDMDTTATKNVSFAVPLNTNASNVQVTAVNIIQNGTPEQLGIEPLSKVVSGSVAGWVNLISLSGSNIVVNLERLTGGHFDATGYSGASNRGYVYVEYEI